MALVYTSGDPLDIERFSKGHQVESWAKIRLRRELLLGRITVCWPSISFNQNQLSFLSRSLWRAEVGSEQDGATVSSLLDIRTLSGVATRSGLNGRLL